MATTRYDLRKSLEEEEANAIGTEYARLTFLPAEDAGRLQAMLRQYTDLRIRFIQRATGRIYSGLMAIQRGCRISFGQLLPPGQNDRRPLYQR
jgi:hypothetical protein